MKNRIAALLLTAVATILGCSGGGPSGGATPPTSSTPPPPAGSPTLRVLPTTYDFGRVTSGNVPAPLEVTISNNGNAALNVASIGMGAASGGSFSLQLNGGARPCGSATPIVAAGESCTFTVAVQPAGGTFTSSVQIASNDTATPAFGLPLSGLSEAVNALSVRINQLDTACPTNEATAYVSVTDQGGYPVLGLGFGHFNVTLGSPTSPNLLKDASYVETAYRPIALAAVLDHSASLTGQPVAFADMKKGFAEFFNLKRPNDIGAVVNFDSEVEVVQSFTSDKALLIAAVSTPWDKGTNTRLYDAVFRAVDETAPHTSYRRAVIVATDGIDQAPSSKTRDEAISNAKARNVAVFTIGIGSSINAGVLEQIASETGGLFYRANTSQNLATIYQQLSTVLYEKQYVLTFDQLERGADTISPLTVGVNWNGINGSAGTNITSCK